MNMKRLFAAFAAGLLLLTVGCAKNAETETLNVAALKGPTGMGLAYVIAEDADFAVTLYDAPDVISGMLINGEADIAAVPINLAAVLYNRTGGEIVMLAVNTLGVLYIVENGESIKSMADLRGKTIAATGEGSTPEYVLRALLAANGLTDSVVIEFVGEHATLAAMAASGEVDVCMLPEPHVSSVLLKNGDARAALNLTEEWEQSMGVPLVQGCYVARREVVERYPDEVQAFVEAATKSADRVNTEEGAAALIAELGILGSEEIAKAAIPRANIVCIRGDEMKTMAESMLRTLYEAAPASVGGALPDSTLYGDF